MSDQDSEIYEKHVFLCTHKGQEALGQLLDQLLTLQLAEINLRFEDRPDQLIDNFSSRSIKILRDEVHAGRLRQLDGCFDGGGCFAFAGGRMTFAMPNEDWNYEVIDSLKNFLSPLFPIALLRNPFIWGITLYLPYTRETLFATRVFSKRSQHLEDPEVDVFRRDEGIVIKLRFHLRDETADMDRGIRMLEDLAYMMMEAIDRRNYEGLEMLQTLCQDPASFRRHEPRTKLGRELKSLVKA